MRSIKLFATFCFAVIFAFQANSQSTPVANFTLQSPVCVSLGGPGGGVLITDLSTGNPTSWSYSVNIGLGQPQVYTAQNPTINLFLPGTVTITLIAANGTGTSTPVSKTITVLQGINANINPASPTLCVGSSPVTLTVAPGFGSGPTTFSWNTGATTQTISVPPVSPNVINYSCTVTGTNGCSITRVATVTIVQTVVKISSVPANICPGSTSTLTATGNVQGPFTYSWSNTATVSTITSSVSGVFSATITNAAGCTASNFYTLGTSTTLSITTSTSPTLICAGNTGSLSAKGGSLYTWSTGNTGSVVPVTPNTTTTYSVYSTLGTCSGTAAITLNVNHTPTIIAQSNYTNICTGAAVVLSANGATTYTWLPGSIVSQTTSVSPNVSTTYTVRGANPACPTRTSSILIKVDPNPNITVNSNTNTVCVGEPVTLFASGASTYSWSIGGNSAFNTFIPTTGKTHVVTVTGTSSNTCVGSGSTSIIANECVSIAKADLQEKIQIFPNPAKGEFFIKGSQITSVQISDLTGKVIFYTNLIPKEGIDIKNLKAGIYFVSVKTPEGILVKKQIVAD